MERHLSQKQISAFQKDIWGYYAKNKRQMAWRETKNPYRILVSEIMLQQTQVLRVVPKYKIFISLFPDIKTLANAQFRDVLRAWSGLGYNRRAKYLHELAKIVFRKHGGIIPHDVETLKKLPGVGEATAHSFLAFAFNAPVSFIETNIRNVFIFYFFSDSKHEDEKIGDEEIFPLITETLDKENPREWYYALMDYGAMLKATRRSQNKKSAQYTRQSSFNGSFRELRGMILKECLKQGVSSLETLRRAIGKHSQKIQHALRDLEAEGFLKVKNQKITLVR